MTTDRRNRRRDRLTLASLLDRQSRGESVALAELASAARQVLEHTLCPGEQRELAVRTLRERHAQELAALRC